MDMILFFVPGILFGALFGALGAFALVLIWQRLFVKQPPGKPSRQLTDEEKREADIQRRELDNFMKYSGDILSNPRENI